MTATRRLTLVAACATTAVGSAALVLTVVLTELRHRAWVDALPAAEAAAGHRIDSWAEVAPALDQVDAVLRLVLPWTLAVGVVVAVMAVLVRQGRAALAAVPVAAVVVGMLGQAGPFSLVTGSLPVSSPVGDVAEYATPAWWSTTVAVVLAAALLAVLGALRLATRGTTPSAPSAPRLTAPLVAFVVGVVAFLVALAENPALPSGADDPGKAFALALSTALLAGSAAGAAVGLHGTAGARATVLLMLAVPLAVGATWAAAAEPGGAPQVLGFLEGADLLVESPVTTALLTAAVPVGWAAGALVRLARRTVRTDRLGLTTPA